MRLIVPQPASVVLPRFGKYELLSPLSTSFFGTRRRARLASSGISGTHALGSGAEAGGKETRALRIVRAQTSEIIERIAHAATAVRHAAHPALLSPLQIVRARLQIGIATQDVAGVTLSELMQHAARRNEAIPQAVALRIALDVIAGLHALEAAIASPDGSAALYGGLTPDSILVGADGQTRLIDPGVQAAAARQSAWRDELSLLQCMAPELTADGARFDARSDLFSIGAIVWQMLSGRVLFACRTAGETIDALRHAPIARAQRVRFVRGEPVTRAVASAVDRALQRDRAARYQSYAELALALREAADVASAEDVAAYVGSDCHAAPQVSDIRGLAPADDPRPDTSHVSHAAPALTAPQVEARRSEPTLEVPVDPATTAPTVPPPRAEVVAELEVARLELPFRLPRWLIAGAAFMTLAFVTWLLVSSGSRPARPAIPRAQSTTTSAKAPAPPQPALAVQPAAPAPSANPEALVDTPQPAPAPSARPTASTAPRAARLKAARTQDAKARKPASNLFIPNDI